MKIKSVQGYELEKELPNTSEDFFNRSEVTYVDKGEEKTFHLLYIRFFDEHFPSLTPFSEEPIMTFGDVVYYFKDIVALVALIKNPGYKNRKRIYINEYKNFETLFEGVQWENVQQLCMKLADGKEYDLESTLDFLHS